MEAENKEHQDKKVVWVTCRAGTGSDGEKGCGGKEAILMSKLKVGNQKAVNLVRYKCTTCGRLFSVSY